VPEADPVQLPATPRRAVILLSHALDPVTLSRHAALRSALGATHDVMLALTGKPGDEAAALGLADAEVLSPDEIFLDAYGAKAASRAIVPGNNDLALLAFARRRPAYAHFWMIEYDVFFPRGAGLLARLDAASDAELITATRPRNRTESADWHWWPTLRHAPSEPRWGLRCAALLCIARYGARLIAELDAAYRAGWDGHFEAVVPTIAARRGMRMEALNTVALRATGERVLNPKSFHHRHCAPSPAARIYHPVKTLEAETALRAALRR
jgi:hypothetical protein